MKYHLKTVYSNWELMEILMYAAKRKDLYRFWPWMSEDCKEAAGFTLNTCHVYRVDAEKNAVHNHPLALFMVSNGEFYVLNQSTASFRACLKVFEAFAAAYPMPLTTYIPPEEKALIRICERYGFEHSGGNKYVKT